MKNVRESPDVLGIHVRVPSEREANCADVQSDVLFNFYHTRNDGLTIRKFGFVRCKTLSVVGRT